MTLMRSPTPATTPPLGFLLVDSARLYRARIDRAFDGAGLGLTIGEARALAHININPGLRQSALAEKMSVEPMTLVGFLDRLEALGLVVREADPTDRRAKIVALTDAARPYLDGIEQAAARAREEATRGFSDEERAQLREFLDRIRGNLARDCAGRESAREARLKEARR
ncbi:MarR family transcriptional regulator [Xanthobacter sp. 126]|jgi:MarR family transcriptional regulator, transcriptional regulator for hemolysin|uniref:MarR family winged helix-turn-helix transcriptional regulator n=1 Tax=Xanthobacter sp. 126 TaxID=1131814 RepID=UPI0004AF6855|nr:MarR family transcriptional regulator [Xanthobacter sp. 126]